MWDIVEELTEDEAARACAEEGVALYGRPPATCLFVVMCCQISKRTNHDFV